VTKISKLFRGKRLWIGFLMAFLPLLLTLVLQFLWLRRVERTSEIADKAVLSNFLEAVTNEVLYAYGPVAERVLDVPLSNFTRGQLDHSAFYFRRREVEGVKVLFVVRFEHDDEGTMLFYDPRSESMEPPPPSDEARAVTVACTPWRLMNDNGIEIDAPRLKVEERDPENRVILNPILDETSRVVGVAGMVLDTAYFRDHLLPQTVKNLIPKFFEGERPDAVVVSVRDERGHLRYATDAQRADREDASRPFSFVFTDWRIGVRGGTLTPEQWARASFAFNLGLSLLAGVLLTGALVLALRTASYEMKLSRMKSDFVSNVSHELRTPLASIRVFGELLHLGRVRAPEKVQEYGEYIETESRRLTQLIENILDFAKIEAGQKTYSYEIADVADVLDATLHTFEVRLRHDGFALTCERAASEDLMARVDRAALGQAFHNLLDNAVSYSGEARRIHVSIGRENGSIVVSVRDFGIGIPRDEQEKIFDRFHRVGTGLVHDVRGSGLGLSIVHHVAAAHGGRVTVESEPGRGSTFTIHLPAWDAAAAKEAASSAEAAPRPEGEACPRS
jgi:signal transduction histidine kinase